MNDLVFLIFVEFFFESVEFSNVVLYIFGELVIIILCVEVCFFFCVLFLIRLI